jgi:ankyrin repeat protein
MATNASKGKIIVLIIATLGIFSCSEKQMQRAPSPGFSFNFLGMQRKANPEEEAFYSAIIDNSGKLDKLEKLLSEGHDPNYMDPQNAMSWLIKNPLWVSISDYNTVGLLLKYKANVNFLPYVGWALASGPILSEKYPEKKLLDWMHDGGENVHTNIRYEKMVYNMIKLLLDNGADPNTICPEAFPSRKLQNETDTRKYFKQKGISPVDNAISRNLFSIVDLLLEHGAKPDEQSLEYAKKATAASGSPEMEKYVKKILEKNRTP